MNAELAAGGPFTLPDGTDVAQLLTWRDELEAFAADVESKTNDREIARGFIDQGKKNLLARLGEFNRKVRALLGRTPYARALPAVVSVQAGEARIMRPFNEMASLWTKINAATIPSFTGPLTLLDDYDLATCEAEIAALKSSYHDYQDYGQQLSLERQRRNDLQDVAYAAMRDYRLGVRALFAPDHALVDALPALNTSSGRRSSSLG